MKWKKICNKHYKISEIGIIKRIKKGRNTYIGKIINPDLNRGYYRVTLSWKNKKGKYVSKRFLVHRLVAKYFIGKCPEGYIVNHVNGNKQYNHYKNLEYTTYKENIKHAHKTGLIKYCCGENHSNSKLTEDNVEEIFSLREGGLTLKKISEMFDISEGYVSRLLNGQTWRHLQKC